MNEQDADFLEKLRATFKLEAEEHLKNISEWLLNLENNVPKDQEQDLINSIFREAHSLKGAARAVNFDQIQSLCQAFENVLAELKKRKIELTPGLFDKCYSTLDLITSVLSAPGENEETTKEIPLLIESLNNIAEGNEIQPRAAPVVPPKRPVEEQPVQPKPSATPVEQKQPAALPIESIPTEPKVAEAVEDKTVPAEHQKSSEKIPEHSHGAPVAAVKQKNIRVASYKLDRLFQQVEELLMIKMSGRQRVDEVINLQDGVKKWLKAWVRVQDDIRFFRTILTNVQGLEKKQMNTLKSIMEFLKEQPVFFKSIRDSLTKLTKSTAQDYRSMGAMVDTLLDDTKKVLMQPFSILLEIFPRMVRDLCHTLSKDVHLEMSGGDIEVDRRILEEMKDPLIHIVRNCIDHGIEKAEERKKAGKPPQGNLIISALQGSGNNVELIIQDDGQGINITQVKNSAIKQGLITQKELDLLNDEEAMRLIFHSGLSTSSIITEISGRGIGLGVVAEKVEKLGGQLFVESKLGIGTTFRIVLPVTLATFRGIYLKVSGHEFIMPTHNVKRVIRIKAEDIRTVENRETVFFEDKTLSYAYLGDVLGLKRTEIAQKYLLALIVKSAETVMAFSVDQVFNEQEVLVKSLGNQLQRVKFIVAATVMEGGNVIPILNPQDLITAAIKGNESSSNVKHQLGMEKKYTILVTDDSITTRMLFANILEGVGYNVLTAVDGLDALTILKTEKVDLLLSDVEMPRMSGFELTAAVRSNNKLENLPIILCTSKGSREDREHGIEVGANAYIDKNTFEQVNFLNIVRRLL